MRLNPRVVSQAVVIATGVCAGGRREVPGCQVGDSETETFWTEFLRNLRDCGLGGAQLVISDAHRGLSNAIGAVLQVASRGVVYFLACCLASESNYAVVAISFRGVVSRLSRSSWKLRWRSPA